MADKQQPVLFLSHAGVDSEAALKLAERIEATPIAKQHGLSVWIDKRRLQGGLDWQAQLEQAISRSTAFAVYYGRTGVINWVEAEVRLALNRATVEKSPPYPFIPIITKQSTIAALPGFARLYQGDGDVDQDEGELSKLLAAAMRLDGTALPEFFGPLAT